MASEQERYGSDPSPSDAAHGARLHAFAHDLRNRLSGMLEVMRQLSSSNGTSDLKELTGFGERQVFAALRRTEELMDEFGAGRSQPVPVLAPVALAEAVEKAINAQRYRFEKKDQPLSLPLASDLRVLADAEQLATMLEALLSNAAKFSPRGGRIAVRIHQDDVSASVEVTDAGPGLSPSDMEQIFVRYAWLSTVSTDGETQGRTSLARCKAMAVSQGGSLHVRNNTEGSGCTFTLRLPLAPA